MDQVQAFHDMLILFAYGLIEQEKNIEDGSFQSVVSLNPHIDRAWQQLSFICWRSNITPPLDLSELVQWLHIAPAQWIGEGIAGFDWSEPLLEAGSVTDYCESLADVLKDETHPRMALEDAHFHAIHHTVREMGKPNLYSDLRVFLIRNPVLEDYMHQVVSNHAWGSILRSMLIECYEKIPPSCIRTQNGKKVVAKCPHCGWTLQWKHNEAVCHLGGPCTSAQGDLSINALWIPYQSNMRRTKEGIQRYVVAPEVLLMDLYARLSNMRGVICTPFPAFDAYDLHIEWDGGVWAVDLKDHHNPHRLARNLPAFDRFPEWKRAFYLFPDYRASHSYLQAFGNRWKREPDVDFMSVSAFVRLINREITP
jgi:hypothetical protein